MTTEVSKEKWDIQQIHEVDCPVKHGFANGVYLREIFMPAGTYVIGKEHKTEHFNIILKGQAYVLMNDDVQLITAPCTFVSEAGTRKVLVVLEDMIWQTTHVNPDNTTDVEELEDKLASKEPVDLALLLPPEDIVKIGEMK
jgi:hypothetical protein